MLLEKQQRGPGERGKDMGAVTSNNLCTYRVLGWQSTSQRPEQFSQTVLDALVATNDFVGFVRGATVYVAAKTNGESATVAIVRDELTSRVFLTGLLASSCPQPCFQLECRCPIRNAQSFYDALSSVASDVSPTPPPAFEPPFFDSCEPLPAYVASVACQRPVSIVTVRDLCVKNFRLQPSTSGPTAWPGVADATYCEVSALRFDGAEMFVVYVTVGGSRVHGMAAVALPNTDYYVPGVNSALSPAGLVYGAFSKFPGAASPPPCA